MKILKKTPVEITSIEIIKDNRFVNAKPEELPLMEYRSDDGGIMRPLVRKGKIVGFKAFDKEGNPLPVLGLEIAGAGANPKFSCYFCRCVKRSCECVPVVCASGPRKKKKHKKGTGEILSIHPPIILNPPPSKK